MPDKKNTRPSAGKRMNERLRFMYTDTVELPKQSESDYYFEHTAAGGATVAADTEHGNITRIKKTSRLKNRLYALVIGLVASLALAVGIGAVVYNSIFVIDTLTVTGNAQYTADELFAAAGISMGDKLYSFSSVDAASAITAKYPRIASVTFERTVPSGVSIHVEMSEAVYYTEIYGEWRMLDGNMRVLEITDKESAKAAGLILVKLPDVKKAIAGSTVAFDEIKNERYIRSVSAAVSASALADRIGSVDCRDIYNITCVCDGKYLVTLGGTSDLAEKLRFLEAVLEDDMFKNPNKATIDITGVGEASVIINNQLVLD